MADRSPPKYAGLVEAVIAFLGGTVLSSIGAVGAASAVGYRLSSNQPMPLAVIVFGLVGLWIGLIGGVIFYSRAWGSGDLRADVGLSFRWWDVLVGAAAGLGTQLVVIPLLYLPFERSDPTLKHRLGAPAKSDTAAIHGAWEIVLLVLFLAVGAPLVEELFFRGLLLRSLTRWAGPIVGVAVSAVLFGLAHFEALQFPGLVLFGVVLAVLAHKTGRLGPGIAAHVAFNAITVVSLTITK